MGYACNKTAQMHVSGQRNPNQNEFHIYKNWEKSSTRVSATLLVSNRQQVICKERFKSKDVIIIFYICGLLNIQTSRLSGYIHAPRPIERVTLLVDLVF